MTNHKTNHFAFQNIRIENTNLCGYKCQMCPREKQTRKKGVMSFDDFKFLIDQFNGFQGQLDLHGYGEPLLDIDLIKKIKYDRKKLKKATLFFCTTLGIAKKQNWFHELVNSGINKIFISCYGFNKEDYFLIHGANTFDLVCENLRLLSYAKKLAENPVEILVIIPNDITVKTLINKKYEKKKFLIWLANLGIDAKAEMELHNYGDGRKYQRPNNKKICSIVWGKRKHILQITWDLKVIPCCFDFNASIVLGDLKKQSFKEIFSSENYSKFINAHKTGKLDDYPICMNCEKDDE